MSWFNVIAFEGRSFKFIHFASHNFEFPHNFHPFVDFQLKFILTFSQNEGISVIIIILRNIFFIKEKNII